MCFLATYSFGNFPILLERGRCYPNSKKSTIPTVANYGPISITPTVNGVDVCRFVLVGLGNIEVCFQRLNPPMRKVSVIVMPFCVCFALSTLESALECRQEDRIVQIDFSATFHRVNHQWIFTKRCSVGILGSVLSVLTQFLSNRSHYFGGEWLLKQSGQRGVGKCFEPTVVHPVLLEAFFITYCRSICIVTLTTPLWLLWCNIHLAE